MKKKVVSILLLCAMGVSLVSGCGTSKNAEKLKLISGIPEERQR